MASLNRVELIGYLGREPEMRYTPGGKAVTSCSVGIGSGSGEGRSTEWVNISAWERTAEVLNTYGKKGALVYVEGRLQTRTWDGQDGAKHSRTEVVVSRLQLLDRKAAGVQPATEDYTIPADDSLPF